MGIIKGKDEQIRELKEGPLAIKFSETKQNLQRLKEVHTKMILYQKQKKTVTVAEYKRLNAKLLEKDCTIRGLEHDKRLLSEKLEETERQLKDGAGVLKANRKTYAMNTHLRFFDHIVNQVPTLNIPILMCQNEIREERDGSDVPHRTTVKLMARDLGAIAELQTAETILHNKNVTLGFHATTQEGIHVNSIHFTMKRD